MTTSKEYQRLIDYCSNLYARYIDHVNGNLEYDARMINEIAHVIKMEMIHIEMETIDIPKKEFDPVKFYKDDVRQYVKFANILSELKKEAELIEKIQSDSK